ncbi:MAG: ribosomal L7Ae/L30e/S12e/Gadd45 family protein [Eubacterium sp.]|nr:ribosomal L7Ae/L30e/S12e/Gadd45 family protein [Eubacterium sp.]
MSDKRLSLLGLAARAGAVQSGGFLTEKAVQSGTAVFVIIAEDASANSRKKIQDKCTYYHVPYAVCETQDILGHKIGKESRSCLAITDENFGRQIAKGFGIEI